MEKTTKEKIILALEKLVRDETIDKDELELGNDFDNDKVDILMQLLEGDNVINFTLPICGDRCGDDFWSQCEYFSNALQKTIIFNYDALNKFDNIDEFAEYVARIQNEIADFESKITLDKGKDVKLYHHKTDGGAEYLFDTFVRWENNGEKGKEGVVNDKTQYRIRLDGQPILTIS